MKFVEAYSHHNAEQEWKKRGHFEWLTDVFESPGLEITKGSTGLIRSHIRQQFDEQGWSNEVRIDPNFDLTVFSIRDDLAFQLQTGNISRAFYDVLKMQHLYTVDKIEVAALAVPSSLAAQRIASNVASFTRIMNELQLFDRTISVPLLLISFE